MANSTSCIERLFLFFFGHLFIVSSGLSGFLPIHPNTYITAWKNRQSELQFEAETLEENKSSKSDENKFEDNEENKSADVEENKSKDSDAITKPSS